MQTLNSPASLEGSFAKSAFLSVIDVSCLACFKDSRLTVEFFQACKYFHLLGLTVIHKYFDVCLLKA